MNEPNPELPPLTPTGVAVLTMMNGEYRRKVIAALKNVRDGWDHLDGETQAIDACIEAVRGIPLVDS